MENRRTINLKWVFIIIFAVGTAALLPLRVLLLLYNYDGSTGFYLSNNALVMAMNILLLVLTLALLASFFMAKRLGGAELPERSHTLGIISLLTGLTMITDALHEIYEGIYVTKSGNIIGSLFEILAAVFFFILAYALARRKPTRMSYLALFPVFWSIVNLFFFMYLKEVISISNNLFDVLKMISIMIFFYYHARLAGNVPNRRITAGIYAFGLTSALFCIISSLPNYIAKLISSSKGGYPSVSDGVYMLLALYIIVLLCKLAKKPSPSDIPCEISEPGPGAGPEQ